MVKSMTALIDQLPIDGWHIIVLLNQLMHHMSGEGQGDCHSNLAWLAPVKPLWRERTPNEPRADYHLIQIAGHRFFDIRDRIRNLENAPERLSKKIK